MRSATFVIAMIVATAVPSPAAESKPRGQPPCVYELLSLDVSSEHAIRLLRKCAPKDSHDALLVAAYTRAHGTLRTPVPAPGPDLGAAVGWIAMLFRAVWWMAWPLTVLALAVVAAAITQPLARNVWRRDPPRIAPPGAEIVVARNLAQLVPTASRVDAQTESARLPLQLLQRPREAMRPGSTDPVVQAVQLALNLYFETAHATMLASQLSALKQRLATGPRFTLADLFVYFDGAVQNGAGLSVRDWADYLDRFGLATFSAAAGGPVMTVVEITELGRLFVGWCDERGYSPQSLAAAGRGF
jgi:hypothetical protein